MPNKKGTRGFAVSISLVERCEAYCKLLGPGWKANGFIEVAIEQFLGLLDAKPGERTVPELAARIDLARAAAAPKPLPEIKPPSPVYDNRRPVSSSVERALEDEGEVVLDEVLRPSLEYTRRRGVAAPIEHRRGRAPVADSDSKGKPAPGGGAQG